MKAAIKRWKFKRSARRVLKSAIGQLEQATEMRVGSPDYHQQLWMARLLLEGTGDIDWSASWSWLELHFPKHIRRINQLYAQLRQRQRELAP